MRTHYDNLKVPEDASQEVIKKAFRALSKKHHPDQNPGNEDSQRIMQILNDAYEVLGNETNRAAYDRRLRMRRVMESATKANPSAASVRPGQGPPPYNRAEAARARSAARRAHGYRQQSSRPPEDPWTVIFRRFGHVMVMFVIVSLYLGSRATLPQTSSTPNDSKPPTNRYSIVSPFRGWQGSTVVLLSNGQRWQQIDSRAILHTSSSMGVNLLYMQPQWYMRVDGMAEWVAVVRVDASNSPFIRRDTDQPLRY